MKGRCFIVRQGYLGSHPPRKCPGSYEKQAPYSVKYSDEGDKPELGSKTNKAVNEARCKSEIEHELAKNGASGSVMLVLAGAWTDKTR